MYIRRNYGFWMTLNWSKWPFICGALYAAVIAGLNVLLDIDLTLPWQPLSVLGIAVAFYLGFKNNSSYDRTWEARKIWGGIVNSSRTFASAVTSFISLVDDEEQRETQRTLIYRHIAWLTALRYQLRLSREWEHTEDRVKAMYIPNICEEYLSRLDHELENLLSPEEINGYRTKANMAAQILATQSRQVHNLYVAGYIDGFHLHRFHQIIQELYAEQGRAERIKNFPFPRQYASTALWTTLVFCALVPFGLLGIFGSSNGQPSWLSIPFSGLIIWVFFLMEKIGDYSENPFEGSYNDVPITSIARAIEIDLREMIGDPDIPRPIAPENGFLM
jgi:ion channel-forming bestrophin family protein